MHAWLRRQRSWLVVEPLPAYAPELNPVEPLWSSLKGVELANLAGEDTLDDVIARPNAASSGSATPTTWPSRSCAAAVCPCGEGEYGTATARTAEVADWIPRRPGQLRHRDDAVVSAQARCAL
jgi:hypothetical protein